ncbi:inorganic phosphate transporter [Aquimonas voraii]|uniref:Phosphate transporter n=1 Tax=Aquimonas voraii TaxID=265719 RepID=A0A1G7ADP7_9GAMM|nr:inorganic phosphate transporter [Aquimonas voraii]SDE12587.1 inorganic phosphate transporter, PiT family [Aquimonas voraii]
MTQSTSPVQTAPSGSRGAELLRLGIAIAFTLGVIAYTWMAHGHLSLSLVVAAAFGAYMAMNIGANDVANNVGPAVGAKAMSLTTAIAIAAVFEAGGAIIAGGEVVGTIKNGIIDPSRIEDPQVFIWLMMAALLAAALWLNLATALGAPVSTTHSIVGAVLGSGIAAAGWDLANWNTMGSIAASWVISPVFGGVVAAIFLYLIKRTITYQADLLEASRRMVPVLLALMGLAFATYLALKGLNQLVKVSLPQALAAGVVVAILTYVWTRLRVRQRSVQLSNDKDGVNKLFGMPLIFAAALLSFAHGSNDVANAIGPLAAIYDTLLTQGIHGKAAIPLWVMLVGALGLAVGLATYGPKLIKTVGTEITDMDHMRAYCIAMAAAVTVIIASQLGLPISTTHVTIGAVFGVGFLREYLKANYARITAEIEAHHRDKGAEQHEVEAFLKAFEAASRADKDRMLKELKAAGKRGEAAISKAERKGLRRVYRKDLVKRAVMMRVIAAWIITVPATAVLSAIIYFTIRGMLLPA